MDNLSENQNKRMRGKLISGAYKATHYQSYHSYRRSIGFSKVLLYLSAIFGIIAFVFSFSSLTFISGVALNLFAFNAVSYFLFDYWISSKHTQMKKDSQTALNEIGAAAGVHGKIDSWFLYDGIYVDERNDSLEIAFTKERTFLGNIIRLVKKQSTLPLNEDAIKALRFYLLKQQENEVYITYATLSADMVDDFEERGIQCEEIPNRFRCKPSRWDYASATGNFANALWSYPRTFKAYTLTVDVEKEHHRNEKYQKASQELKEDKDSLIRLKKLK